jgi:hypothetical protein
VKKFTIARAHFSSSKQMWYVAVKGNSCGYLHCDGIIRHGTFDSDKGMYSGWYETRKLAREAVAKFRSLQAL